MIVERPDHHCGDDLVHGTANIVMAECACASLIFTSFNDVPKLVCVDLKYLNWSTSSNTFPFVRILVLLMRILLLSELISHVSNR